MSAERMNPLAKLGLHMRRGFGRVLPDPFFIAVGLLWVVLLVGVATGHDPLAILAVATSDAGLWSLLTFTLQMSLVLMFGNALAASPPVRALADRVVRLASSPRQLVGLTALSAVMLALLNWGLGLMGGALVARAAGRRVVREGWPLHYPLLCAAGYSGMMVWHGGLSGSAPLKAADLRGLEEVLGPALAGRVGAIPVGDTLLGPLNLIVTTGLVVLAPLVFMAMTPAVDPAPHAPPPDMGDMGDTGDTSDAGASDDADETVTRHDARSRLERVEDSPVVTWSLAALLGGGAVLAIARAGMQALGLNLVIALSWVAAMIFYRTPRRFADACETGLRSCTGIIVQFPLYGAITGVLAFIGLTDWLGTRMAGVGRELYLVATFASGGMLNLFIPSGGGQWALQGPVVMRGAIALDLAPRDVVMALAYGDQWTNMLQPFWALALLELTGVRARDIIGYTTSWMLLGGVWIVGVLLAWA